MSAKIIENQYSRVWLEDDIVNAVFKASKIDLEIAEVCVRDRLAVTDSVTRPVFADITHVSNISKEARDYFSSGDSVRYISAAALLASSSISKIMGNFFLAFNKPSVPIKLFTNKADAMKWLEKYKAS